MKLSLQHADASWHETHDALHTGLEWLPDLLGFLRRQFMVIALCTIAVTALGVVYMVFASPRYTATTTLLIDIQTAQLMKPRVQGVDHDPAQSIDPNYVPSQAEVLGSEGIARLVVKDLDLTHNAQFLANGRPNPLARLIGFVIGLIPSSESAGPGSDEDDVTLAAQILETMTSVKRTGMTAIVDVSVKANSARLAADLANGIADAYNRGGLQAKADVARDASVWLEERSHQILEQAQAADRRLQEFKAANNIVDTDKGLLNEGQLSELNTQLALARANLAQAEARYDQIRSIIKAGRFDGNVVDALGNEVIIHLRQQYTDVSRQMADWTSKYGPNHVSVINAQNQLRELQNQLQSELQRIADSYKSSYEVALAGEQALEKALSRLSADSAGTNNKLVTLRDLQSSASTLRTQYETFLQRFTQAVQDESFPIPEARVVTRAAVPLRKSWPQGLIVLPGSIMLGLMVGFGVAFVREATDKSLRTAQQVPRMLGLEFMGFLPLLSARESRATALLPPPDNGSGSARTITYSHPLLRQVTEHVFSPFAEIMRTVSLRISREQREGRPVKVVGCVSTLPGEGKSTVATALAQYLADTGAKTLLIDWDLRRLTLSRLLAPGARAGFTDMVRSGARLEDMVFTEPQTGLQFLPGGSQTALPEMLRHEAGPAMLRSMKDRFDYVIVDLPAMSVAADAFAASALMDHLIVIAAWGDTNRDSVNHCLQQLRVYQPNILGLILNKVNVRAMKRYAEFDTATQYYAL